MRVGFLRVPFGVDCFLGPSAPMMVPVLLDVFFVTFFLVGFADLRLSGAVLPLGGDFFPRLVVCLEPRVVVCFERLGVVVCFERLGRRLPGLSGWSTNPRS